LQIEIGIIGFSSESKQLATIYLATVTHPTAVISRPSSNKKNELNNTEGEEEENNLGKNYMQRSRSGYVLFLGVSMGWGPGGR
jgi:hypothetical protein